MYLRSLVDTNEHEIKKFIHISIVMIFIVHATITDAQQSQENNNFGDRGIHYLTTVPEKPLTLPQILTRPLPSMALRQTVDIVMLMLDRVLEAPSPWLMSIFPVVMWLTLHKDDGIFTDHA